MDLTRFGQGNLLDDEAKAAQLIVKNALKAEEDGVDACIIDCFYDRGIEECSSALRIPVVGVCMAGMLLAYSMPGKFAVITTEKTGIPRIESNAHRYGVASKLQSVVSIEYPWQEIPTHSEEVAQLLVQAGKELVSVASTFILGCTDLSNMADPLREELRSLAPNVRVIDPILPAIHLAEIRATVEVESEKGVCSH
jgi:allantoin racemase